MTNRVKCDGKVYVKGDVTEVADSIADELIEAGAAIPYKKVVVVEDESGKVGKSKKKEAKKEAKEVVKEEEKEVKLENFKRKKLNKIADGLGIAYEELKTRQDVIDAIEAKENGEKVDSDEDVDEEETDEDVDSDEEDDESEEEDDEEESDSDEDEKTDTAKE